MNAKEYLGPAYRIDQRINSKIDQISSLHALATKATTTISDMPGSATRNVHRMEDIIVKIMEMEEDINAEIDTLVDLKAEIMDVIKSVDNLEYQTILELRYLCFKPWEQIALDLSYSINNVFKMHKKSIEELERSHVYRETVLERAAVLEKNETL